MPASLSPTPEAAAAAPRLQEELPVSDATQSVIQRVIAEHRRVVYALVAGVVINVLVFAFLVYPLQSDVANVEQRTRTAEAALAAAQADFARANGTLTGKDRALKELDTFYSSVLAKDLTGARRLTFARLAQMAAQLADWISSAASTSRSSSAAAT